MVFAILFSLLQWMTTSPVVANHPPQVIQIQVTDQGFSPAKIELKQGVVTKIIVTRHTQSGCLSQIQFPDFGIKPTNLPLHKPITFTVKPTKAGSFRFACGMNMVKGTAVVKSI